MKNAPIAVTPLSLPKGGGAIQGVGETFQAEAFTGSASLSIPLSTSPCRDFEPHLSLDYSSGSGNGIFGLGFSLSIPTIARKTSKGLPLYDDSDTFLLSSAEDLVPALDGQHEETRNNITYRVSAYLPRLEGPFAAIEHWSEKQGGNSHWRVVSRDNTTSLFGTTVNTRIADPENPRHIFQWLLAETFDARGNQIIYEYASENRGNVPPTLSEKNRTQTANKYIRRIAYGNVEPFQEGQTTPERWHFEVIFDYGEYLVDPTNPTPFTPVQLWANRPDSFSTYQAGFEIRTHRLCRHILMFHRFEELGPDPILVHATRFHYQTAPTISLLQAVESIGYRYENSRYQTRSLPPLEFNYTTFQPAGHDFEPLQEDQDQFLPGINRLPEYQLIDLYGEGIPGILYNDGRTTLYWEPESSGDGREARQVVRYAPPQAPPAFPIDGYRQSASNLQFIDLTGNGRLDLLAGTPTSAGYYEANADRTWNRFRILPSFPTDFYNPDNYLVDVTGDGLADLLFLDDERIYVYPSLGTDGFGSALTRNRNQNVPLPRQGATNEVLEFADLFGNGMSHLVRITNGKVECWPNLGYGLFGKPVLLDHAPHFEPHLDASRLFLADLDGSGTADIIYAYPDHIEIFFNQSGNSFSDPLSIPLPCLWDRINHIEFADIYGNGAACLLLSQLYPQPHHWCYDFIQRQKPYLLNGIDNHMGAQSTITYCSSTSYYLDDKKKGSPWIFNLPFPVQVVKKTESVDLISQTRLTSTYSYHHGYYDGIEREFRGFGLVERQDAETVLADAQPTDVPPVLTRTWYHTGAWQYHDSLSRQYQHEYYQGDPQAYLLPDSVLAVTTGDRNAWREAARALKGLVLREEVYALTAPTMLPEQLQNTPYTVTERNYRVKQIQARGQNKYGVYFAHPQETLTSDYERNPNDPRVHHHFILDVDAYGNVLSSCEVAYGRRQLSGEELPEQLSWKVTADEDRFSNQTGKGVHLLGVPQEHKTYEITNLPLAPGQAYITFDQIRKHLAQVVGTAFARMLNWQRYYYWSPEQKQPYSLPGQVSPQALHARTDTAVFTPEQVEQAFAGALTKDDLDTLLAQAGGYQLDPEKTCWWNPGLTELFLEASQFFLPGAITDYHGNRTAYVHDSHALLPVKITDALNNQTVVQALDYQTLAPQQLRDINGNMSEVLFDPLGMVVVTSYYGTENGQTTGFMQLKDYQQQSAAGMDDVISHAQTYLQGASSYFYYDLFSWTDHQIPVHAVSLVATTYPDSGPSPIQISIRYSNGFGRELQSTLKVEPGEAHIINPDGTITVAVASDRWLTSGRTVYNNKGNPIKQYEPYYIDTYKYIDNPHLNTFGVSPSLFYDPLERLIRVETAKGFFSKTEFTPWTQTHYDENDTIKDSRYYQNNIDNQATDFQDERQALQKASLFYNTPTTRVLDNLGRIILEIQQAGTLLKTHFTWDIQGHQIANADPRLSASGKENFRVIYAMTGEVLKMVSADAGTRWQLHNAMGVPIYSRDSRNVELLKSYDALYRPTAVRVRGGDGSVPLDQIVEKMIYGDSLDEAGQPAIANPESRNLRGRLYKHFDQAGVLQQNAYTILGHPLQISRQLKQGYKQEANWHDTSATTLTTLLQPTIYQETYQYDALGHITAATNPDGNVSELIYHLSGRLNQVQVRPQAGQPAEIYVQGIEYDAKNQRQRILYGNGVTTRYDYEPTTFRLAHILTIRASDRRKLQDLTYTYDPVGNITHIADGAQEPVFNANQQVNSASDYTYDALYRLIVARGREHPALSPQEEQQGGFNAKWIIPLQPLNNGQALQNYTQQFTYDDSGNLCRIQHQGAAAWTRTLTVSDSTNRAVENVLANKPAEVNAYFDRNGNQVRMAGLQTIAWNYRDNIACAMVVERQDGPADGEYSVYDSSGQRVRKVSEQYGNGGMVAHIEETMYLGSLEIKRITQGSKVVEERHSLRVMDDERAVATRITWTQGTPPDGVKNPQVRYQLDNHLGSAVLEVDAGGQVISYEEYFPYGCTALIAGRSISEVQLKKYRYMGKERDSVTGLYYYGARYYAPWLGRWMSPDPAGTVDGLNLYMFVRDNPLRFVDVRGNVTVDHWNVKDKTRETLLADAFIKQLGATVSDAYKDDKQYIIGLTEIMDSVTDNDLTEFTHALNKQTGLDLQGELLSAGSSPGGYRREKIAILHTGFERAEMVSYKKDRRRGRDNARWPVGINVQASIGGFSKETLKIAFFHNINPDDAGTESSYWRDKLSNLKVHVTTGDWNTEPPLEWSRQEAEDEPPRKRLRHSEMFEYTTFSNIPTSKGGKMYDYGLATYPQIRQLGLYVTNETLIPHQGSDHYPNRVKLKARRRMR